MSSHPNPKGLRPEENKKKNAVPDRHEEVAQPTMDIHVDFVNTFKASYLRNNKSKLKKNMR